MTEDEQIAALQRMLNGQRSATKSTRRGTTAGPGNVSNPGDPLCSTARSRCSGWHKAYSP